MARQRRDVEVLVNEFQGAGQSLCDARRSAFCALAHSQGWGAATIGRYLGVSRQGAGQRIAHLHWLAGREGMTQLAALLAQTTPGDGVVVELPIGFPADNWQHDEFALGILEQLAA